MPVDSQDCALFLPAADATRTKAAGGGFGERAEGESAERAALGRAIAGQGLTAIQARNFVNRARSAESKHDDSHALTSAASVQRSSSNATDRKRLVGKPFRLLREPELHHETRQVPVAAMAFDLALDDREKGGERRAHLAVRRWDGRPIGHLHRPRMRSDPETLDRDLVALLDDTGDFETRIGERLLVSVEEPTHPFGHRQGSHWREEFRAACKTCKRYFGVLRCVVEVLHRDRLVGHGSLLGVARYAFPGGD